METATHRTPIAGQLNAGQAYAFAVLATGGTLCLRLTLDSFFGGRPLLIIFILPILLSGYAGGTRAAGLATLLSYGASFLLLPPFHSFHAPIAPDRWPQFFVVAIGIVISLLSGAAIRHSRQRAEVAFEHAKDAITKAENIQTAIFRCANFSCIATDAMGIIQVFNAGAEKMFGYRADQIVGKSSLLDLHKPQGVNRPVDGMGLPSGPLLDSGFDALIEKASRGFECSYEINQVRKDGGRLMAIVSITALHDSNGNIIGYLMIATDNTARHQIEEVRKKSAEDLQRANIKLESAKLAAESANRAKSEFLSNMSHELRTPLSAVLGFTQLMELSDPPPTPSQAKNISRILHAGRYLLKLINEILDLAAIESGKLPLAKDSVSLSKVLTTCRTMVEPQAEQRGVELIFPKFTDPMFVRADATRLEQILINLLSNAVKYNKEGGVVVVDCTVSEPGRIRIGVRDTGVGLSPEKLDQLFVPFNRLGQETGTIPGTGIGLVVSRRLAELMDGSLGVESKVGEGSVFWCELSVAAAPSASVFRDVEKTLAKPSMSNELPSCTLLYIGNNPAKMKLIEEFITQLPSIRLISAVDATQGIRRAQTTRPKAILFDVDLPATSDMEALKVLHKNPATAQIPLIAMTAASIPSGIEKELKGEVFCQLTKPLEITEFKYNLGAALRHEDEQFALAGAGGRDL